MERLTDGELKSTSEESLAREFQPENILPTPSYHGLDELISRGDSFSIYRQEALGHPLLDKEEEKRLFELFKKGREAARELEFDGDSQERKEELQSLVEIGSVSREVIVGANQRLVVSVVKQYLGRGLAIEDLEQEGNIGLFKAIENFDIEKGNRFSTYAVWWIRQTTTRALGNRSKTIRMPINAQRELRAVRKAEKRLKQRENKPTDEQLEKESGIRVDRIRALRRAALEPLSLEMPIDNGDLTLGDTIEDEVSGTVEARLNGNLLREQIRNALDTLTPREAKILELRFGLDGAGERTLEEVGEKFGLTRERIRQIQKKAIRRLRHPRRSRKLKDFLE
jgi:RNA polymerase primary sigma factor